MSYFDSKRTTTLILVLALAAGPAFAQRTARLLDAEAADLVATVLVDPAPGLLAEVASEPLSSHRALAGDLALEHRGEPFRSRSREHWLEASTEELERGVAIYTTAPGALVRLHPIVLPAGAELAIDPRLLAIESGGAVYRSGTGMEELVGSEQLDAAGSPFAEGTAAFRIARELGAGRLTLRSEGLGAPPGSRFLINVFEPASEVELTVAADRASYLHGGLLRIEAQLGGGGSALAAERIEGFVTSPAGRSWPLTFERAEGGVYRAGLVLDADEAPHPGLWEAQVAASGRHRGLVAVRGARTAFAVALPTARLDGGVEVIGARGRRGAAPAAIALGLEVAASGRYEASGVLYGTDESGELRPLALAQSAAWLEAGRHRLELRFGQLTAGSKLAAPFELRGLRLSDQGRMGVLHEQERALVME